MKNLSDGKTLSLAANGTTRAWRVDHFEGYSVAIVWTGTPDGNIKLQASNDAFKDDEARWDEENPNALWVDIPDSSVAGGGASGSHLYNVADVYYRAFRIAYADHTAGSGSATIQIFGKGIQ